MTIALYAFTCGEVTGFREGFLEGETGRLTVPVPAYLIDHPRGKVIFDTGLNIGLRQNAAKLLGPVARDFDVDLPADADIVSRLAALNFAPRDIRYVVNSHLHFDHCGGNGLFPDATVIVQAREWRAAQHPKLQAIGTYSPHDFAHGQSIMEIEGEHDIFGDGLVVLLPTFGHTPGHQSLRVQLPSGPVVLAADCCYLKQTLDHLHLPKFAYDKDQMRTTLMRLRVMQSEGARIFFGHDPEFWQTVPQGTAIT